MEAAAKRPMTYEEEILEGYLAPEIKSIDDLLYEFPIELVADTGGIGLKQFTVFWADGRASMEDGEPYDRFKESMSTCDDHHADFYQWEKVRLLHTLKHYKNLFTVNENDKGVLAFSLRENLMPLQMLMKGPFTWEQEGSTIGVKMHGNKMEALGKFAPRFRGPAFYAFVKEITGRMMARLRESENCEVVESPEGSAYLFEVNLLGLDEDAPMKKTPAPAPAPKAPVAPAPAPAPKAPVAPSPKALEVLKSGFPVVWKRFADAQCLRKDDRGYFHAIEVKSAYLRDARRIDSDLFAALKPCADCKVLAPPTGSPFLFVVQVLPPRL